MNTWRFCRQKHRHRNTDPTIGPGGEGNPAGSPRKTTKKLRKPTESQEPCPDLRGFCINAPTEVAMWVRNLCNVELLAGHQLGDFRRSLHRLLRRTLRFVSLCLHGSGCLIPAVLKVKMKNRTEIDPPRMRPDTPASEGKRQSGPSRGIPRGRGDTNK